MLIIDDFFCPFCNRDISWEKIPLTLQKRIEDDKPTSFSCPYCTSPFSLRVVNDQVIVDEDVHRTQTNPFLQDNPGWMDQSNWLPHPPIRQQTGKEEFLPYPDPAVLESMVNLLSWYEQVGEQAKTIKEQLLPWLQWIKNNQ